MDPELNKPTNVVFIGGTGRCGTNIAKEVLSEHAKVASLPFEYRFTIDPHGIVACYNTIKYSWSPYIVHNSIKELEKVLLSMETKNQSDSGPYIDWELEKWFPNYHRHIDDLLKKLKEHNYRGNWPGEKSHQNANQMYFLTYKGKLEQIFRSFLRALFNDLLHKNHKKIFVEDNTWNMLFAPELRTILPEAKFIHVVRDPRDVIVSLSHQRWAPKKLEAAIRYYQSLMDKIMEVSDNIPHRCLLHIKLEDLVLEPAKIMNKICDFLEIPAFSKPLKKDVSHAHNGKWERELNSKEKRKLTGATKKYCSYYSYQL